MYSIPNIEMLLACVAMGFIGSLLWAAWSRVWDWWMESATEDAQARHLIKMLGHITTMEHNALAERLDKIEDIVYNARKFDTVQEFQNHRVPYASKNTCGGPVDPPTCW